MAIQFAIRDLCRDHVAILQPTSAHEVGIRAKNAYFLQFTMKSE